MTRLRWLICFLPLFVAGCTLLSPYDEITDRNVNDLSIRTEMVLAQADAGQLSLAESQRFLVESMGTVRAMEVRARLLPKNTEEIAILEELEKRYQALFNRGRPLRSSMATGLRATLLDLQQIQIIKKRSAATGTSPRKANAS